MAEEKTILFVDDEEDMRVLVSSVLEEAGYRVLTAPDAPSGLKVAFSEFPDLIITDVMMPGESGFSLCEKIKADESTKEIPVVFLSVMDEETRGLQVGAAAFLGKPFDVQELRQTVEGILSHDASRGLLESALEDLRERRVDDAMAGFQKVLEQDPKAPSALWARYYMGQVHDQRGEAEKAQRNFQEILERDAEFYRAHNRLGLVAERNDDPRRAIQHFERSLALHPSQPDVGRKLEELRQKHRPSDVS